MHIIGNSLGLPCNPANLIWNVAWSDTSKPPVITPPMTETRAPAINEYPNIFAHTFEVIINHPKAINPNNCI